MTMLRKELSHKVIEFPRDASFFYNRGLKLCHRHNLEKGILFLRRSIELDPQNAAYRFDLAEAYCHIGILEEANKQFLKIVNEIDLSMTKCYFYLALNYGFMNNLKLALRYLNLYMQNNPDGEKSIDAAELIDYIDAVLNEPKLVSCSFDKEKMISLESFREMMQDPVSFSFLRQRLRFGNHLYKMHIVSLLGETAGQNSLQLLAEIASSQRQPREVREASFINLQRKMVLFAYRPHFDPKGKNIGNENLVLKCIRKYSKDIFKKQEFLAEAEAIWRDFWAGQASAAPVIRKPETWAAGVVYTLSCYHFMQITQADIADAFGVSPASVSEKFRAIDQIVDIRLSARQAMEAYLQLSDIKN